MSVSAAELQKKHELEGTPDPFPSLSNGDSSTGNTATKIKKNTGKTQPIDTSSEAAFPSLASAKGRSPGASTGGAWSGAAARSTPVHRPAVQANNVTETVVLDGIQIPRPHKEGVKAQTLGDVMRNVMAKSQTTVEASTARNSGKTTFIIKGMSDASIQMAKKMLVATLSPTVTKIVDAPTSAVGSIIGTKGAMLNQIREKTNVRIDIPKPGAHPANVPANGQHTPAEGSATPRSASASPVEKDKDEYEEDEEPTVPITVSGPSTMVHEAIAMIQAIINTKTSKVTQRIKDVPEHVLPFLSHRLPKLQEELLAEYSEGGEVSLDYQIDSKAGQITLTGNRVVVLPAMEKLKALTTEIVEDLNNVTLSLPRAQHRFVRDQATVDDLMEQYGVAVSVGSDGLVLYGTDKLGEALTAVLAKSTKWHVQSAKLQGGKETREHTLEYLKRADYLHSVLGNAHPEVTIHDPEVDPKSEDTFIDISGDKKLVTAAIKDCDEFLKRLHHIVKQLEVDSVLHRAIEAKSTQYREKHNVQVFLPQSGSQSSHVLVVFDPLSPRGKTGSNNDHAKQVAAVAADIQQLVKSAGPLETERVDVPRKWHSAVLQQRETLTGEELKLSIATSGAAIVVRGPPAEVKRVVNAIREVVEDAEKEAEENSWFTEFDIPREYVRHVVGAQGNAIKQIKEAFSVRVDLTDEPSAEDGSEWSTEKKPGGSKKQQQQGMLKTKVKVIGRKENALEAKKKILAQVDKMADEAEERITIAKAHHPALIGPSGKYVLRLEEHHAVKITFPRDNDNGSGFRGRDNLGPNEVLIKGGKKGVASAKSELLALVDFEKANNHIVQFEVATKAVARILGRGGASISEIKQNTGAAIDVEKEESSPGKTLFTVRGTADETKQAKAAILAIASEVGDEATEIVIIEAKYHRNFIGKGGETLKQIIIGAGGPEDSRAHAGLVHFPRAGEAADEVRLRGDKKLVAKLKKELEKLATTYRDRIVLGANVPAAQHRALIGRGGQHLNALQEKTGTQIWFPGSRAYATAGEIENAEDLGEVPVEDLVKVCGPKAGCQAAVAELASKAEAVPSPRPSRLSSQTTVTRTMTVPLKYHHAIVHQGGLQRTLRNHNVHVDFSTVPNNEHHPVRPTKDASVAGRIDQDDAADPGAAGMEWEVIPNYEHAEDGDSEWTLKGRDEAALDTAEEIVNEAMERAKAATHIGFLTVTDRSVFPRVVGTKGANVSRIRDQTGADITVGKGDNTIVIIGSESSLDSAKHAILETIEGGSRPRRD